MRQPPTRLGENDVSAGTTVPADLDPDALLARSVRANAPDDERERLVALEALRILDTDPEAAFDALTRLAADICSVPIALVSLIDENRQWFKSRVGLDVSETSRDMAFCAHAILDREPMVVENTLHDERFASNPLVLGDPSIRFYAGAPLITADGHALGTLCVIDSEPRHLDATQLRLLAALADQVVALIELRALTTQLGDALSAKHAAEHALRHEAHHDHLTGLANRRLFFEALTSHLSVSPAGVIFIDLDHFKTVNDTYGHHAGDELLVHTANKIVSAVRSVDLVARLGGDEFAVLTDIVDPVLLEEMAIRVREDLRRPVVIDGIPIVTSAAVGASVSGIGDGAERALRRADEVMYGDKVAGDPRLDANDSIASLRSAARSDAALKAVLDSSHDGIMAFRSIRDVHQEIVDFVWTTVNRRAAEIVGRPIDELMGACLLQVFPANLDEGLFHTYCQVVRSGESCEFEHFYEHEGLSHWFRTTVTPLGDGFTVTFRDISADKRVQATLEYQASHDELTGVPNRGALLARLEDRFTAGNLVGEPFGLLFIGLDRFKVVNDALGHAIGDDLLCAIAARLTERFGLDGNFFRFGSDEFVIIADGVPSAIDSIVNEVQCLVEAPCNLSGRSLRVTASIGIAEAGGSNEAGGGDGAVTDAAGLIRDADTALCVAKRREARSVERFTEPIRRARRDRVELELDLLPAVVRNQLVIQYQPVIEMASGQLFGAEALVRWQHPRRGRLSPDEFIPIAQESGLVSMIDRHVIRTVIEQLRHWSEVGRRDIVVIGVNVSPSELHQDGFAEFVLDSLDAAQVNPAMLSMEITESALMIDSATARTTLLQLAAAGVVITLDDFGTGYSSISHLKEYPVHSVKIDRSFVSSIDTNKSDRTLVGAVISMTHALDMFTVAEGIETVRQADILKELGAEFGQGYLYSPAVDPEDL